MLRGQRCVWDPVGWGVAAVEWWLLWWMIWPEDGRLRREEVRGVYDGSVFWRVAARRRGYACECGFKWEHEGGVWCAQPVRLMLVKYAHRLRQWWGWGWRAWRLRRWSESVWTYRPWTYRPWTYRPWTYRPWTYRPWAYKTWTYKPWTYRPWNHQIQTTIPAHLAPLDLAHVDEKIVAILPETPLLPETKLLDTVSLPVENIVVKPRPLGPLGKRVWNGL